MNVINKFVKSILAGLAPVDYNHLAQAEIKLDDEALVYASVCTHYTGEQLYIISKDPVLLCGFECSEKIESYESLKDAKVTKYYDVFKELDKMTSEEHKVVFEELDDTANYGIRYCSYIDGKQHKYVEAAAELKKYNKVVYLQIDNTDTNVYRYTLTDQSIFLRKALNVLYEMYYDKKEEVKYLIDANDLNNITTDVDYLKEYLNDFANDFKEVKENMNEYFKKNNL